MITRRSVPAGEIMTAMAGWTFTMEKGHSGGDGTVNRLFRNNADGTFTEVGEPTRAADPGKVPFCSAFLDYNNDLWPDIYTANDRKSINTLLRNNADGTYDDVGHAAGADLEMDAMCVAVGDYDNDGLQDIYVSNTNTGNALLNNEGAAIEGDPVTFAEIAASSGTGLLWDWLGKQFL